MKIITYLTDASEFNCFKECGVTELIIPVESFSRIGNVSIEDAKSLAKLCVENNIRPILEWDILMVESEFIRYSKEVSELIQNSEFKTIRTYDPGATQYIVTNHKDISVQLILEIGNHNIRSIEGWIKIVGEQLDRLILSQEFSEDVLRDYIDRIGVPVEYYGLGRLLLAYSPRKLLSKQFTFKGPIEVKANSLESPHKNFPIVENTHGTFTFYMRDLGLVDYLDRLRGIGLSFVRVDLRHLDVKTWLPKFNHLMNNFSVEAATKFREEYPVELFKGFFGKNRSDVVFSKLKNKKIQRIDENYIGEVVDVAKKSYMGILIKGASIKVVPGMHLEIRTPEGRIKKCQVRELRDSCNNVIESALKGQLFYLSHTSGVSVKSAVFLTKED